MAALSNYLENKFLDHLLRGQVFTPPTTVYVALMLEAPTEHGTGLEVTGTGYARAPVACNLNTWAGTNGAGSTAVSTGSSGTTSNNDIISFNAPQSDWGVVTHIAIYDSPSGGNMLWRAQLVASKQILSGDPAPNFPPAALALQLDD